MTAYFSYWKFSVSGVLITALLGCAKPEPNVPLEHVTKPQSSSQKSVPIIDKWTEINRALARVSDPASKTFLAVIATAYSYDPSVVAAAIRASAKSTAADTASQKIRPELFVSGATFSDGLTVTASQPLFDFGKRTAAVGEFKAEQEIEVVRQAQARERLLADALRAVLNSDFAIARARLHRRQISDFIKARDAAQRLADINLLTAADVRLADVERQSAEIDLAVAQADEVAAKVLWTSVSGQAAIPNGLQPLALRKAFNVGTLAQAQQASYIRSLRLRSIGAQRAQLEAQSESLRRRNSPTISAALEALVGGRNNDLNAGLTISYPILRREPNDRLAERNSELSAAAVDAEAVKRELQFEIQGASLDASSARQLARSQRKSLALLTERVRDLEFQLETGLATYIDLIQARERVFETELEILAHEDDARRADADILVLSGSLIP